MDFNQILANTLLHEGGYTEDVGGPTNRGVTQRSYDDHIKRNNLPSKSVKEMTWGEMKEFYQKDYYENPKIDQLPSHKVQGLIFDWGVNSGPATAIKRFQNIIGTKSDGLIGKKTTKAMEDYTAKYGEAQLVSAILQDRRQFLQGLIFQNPVKYGEYERGWANRINKLTQQYGQ